MPLTGGFVPGMWRLRGGREGPYRDQAEVSLPPPFYSSRGPQPPARLRRRDCGRHLCGARVEEPVGVFKATPRLLCAFFPIPFCHLLYLKCHLPAPTASALPAVRSLPQATAEPPVPATMVHGVSTSQSPLRRTGSRRQHQKRYAGAETAGSTERLVECLALSVGDIPFCYVFQYFPKLLQSPSIT